MEKEYLCTKIRNSSGNSKAGIYPAHFLNAQHGLPWVGEINYSILQSFQPQIIRVFLLKVMLLGNVLPELLNGKFPDFLPVILNAMKAFNIPREKINIMGGGISIGHPLGATGSRILGTLARLLRQKGKKYGVATLCVGGGQGYSVVLEAE